MPRLPTLACRRAFYCLSRYRTAPFQQHAMTAESAASMVHHGGRGGLGSVELRSAKACLDSPPYVEKEIWCPFRDRGNPFDVICFRLMSRRPRFNGQIRWQNQVAVGLTPRNARDGARTGQ
jgi:hypothetical protein